MMTIWNIIAGMAVILTSLNITPQLIKGFKTKKTKDLSFTMLFTIMGGNILWVVHAIHNKDWALFTANIILLISAITLILMKYKYDKKN